MKGHGGLPPGKDPKRISMRLANEIGNAPAMVLCAPLAKDPAVYASVVPSAQNILQASHTLGIGGTIATLPDHGPCSLLHALWVSQRFAVDHRDQPISQGRYDKPFLRRGCNHEMVPVSSEWCD